MTTKPVWSLSMIENQLEGGDPFNPVLHEWVLPNSTLTLDSSGNVYWVPVITYSTTGIARDHDWISGTSADMAQIEAPTANEVADITTAFQEWGDLIAPRLRSTDDPNADI